MEKLDCSKKALKKFAVTMGVAFLVVAFLILLRHHRGASVWVGLSVVFFILGFAAPDSLRLAYIGWMRLAFILGWINTRIILAFVFYLILTPIGVAMRIFGKDLMERRLEKDKVSYWLPKDEKEFSKADYERQF